MTTGGAYAIERIGSAEVADDSLSRADLRDRKAVKAKDVKRDSLTGKELREATLDASGFARVAGVGDALDCNPSSTAPIDCVATTLELDLPSRVLVVTTGGQCPGSGSAGGSAGGVRHHRKRRADERCSYPR